MSLIIRELPPLWLLAPDLFDVRTLRRLFFYKWLYNVGRLNDG